MESLSLWESQRVYGKARHPGPEKMGPGTHQLWLCGSRTGGPSAVLQRGGWDSSWSLWFVSVCTSPSVLGDLAAGSAGTECLVGLPEVTLPFLSQEWVVPQGDIQGRSCSQEKRGCFFQKRVMDKRTQNNHTSNLCTSLRHNHIWIQIGWYTL